MAELRNIKWNRFLEGLLEPDASPALLKSKSLQWWLTIGLRKQGFILLDDLEGLVLEYKGIKFQPDLINYPRIFEAWDRYKIQALRPSDTVLDIGANIGSFTLPAAKRCKKVVAMEPIFFDTLRRNVELNNLTNVELHRKSFLATEVDCQGSKAQSIVYPYGTTDIDWKSFSVIRLDCGGSEWNFYPELLETPRQLEVEFHFFKNEHKKVSSWPLWKSWLERNSYGYIARWSKHRHWLYLSASKERQTRLEVQLTDGSFRGKSRELWNS